MKVIPKLNLNQNPQNCEEGSLVFAKNMKLDSDDSLTSDFGSEDLNNCTTDDVNFVGHIVGLDNKIYLFSHIYDDTNNKNYDYIYEYNEITKKATKLTTGWTYSGGEIDGCVSTNISGEKILSIAEYDNSGTKNIPLKHINLSFCKNTDDESLYTQAPRVPICNLTLNNTYAKTIPNGTYVFFIRYKIRKDCYTNWYLCSNPIFGGTSTKITTLQGGVSYIDNHTDAAKSFIFNISFINESAKTLYNSFQLGFILTHDNASNARSWKEFDMNTSVIYFDYEDIKEINIDDLLSTTYNIYNVRNITNFKNKLYISNYKESEINVNTSDIDKCLEIEYNHSDPEGINDIDYYNLTYNNNKLIHNNKGYYDMINYNGEIVTVKYIINKNDFDFKYSKFYKEDVIEKNKLATFDIKWDYKYNPDLCTVYNIFNDSYNGAIFGKTEERLFNEGKIGIIERYNEGGVWLYDRDLSNPHQWDDLGFTFIYGSTEEKDSSTITSARNGVFKFNKKTKNYGIAGKTENNYWASRDKGFSNEARAFIKKNIKDEIEKKSRLIYCYLELSLGAEIYTIGYNSYMNKDNYIGDTNDEDYGIENTKTSVLNSKIINKIKDTVFNTIKDYTIGVDENGSILLYLNNSYVRVSTATVVFKSIEFTVEDEDLLDDNEHFNKRFYINAKITNYKSICNFNLKESVIKKDDTAIKSLAQKPTLMPFSKYRIYAHYVDENHIITNGSFIKTIETDNAKSNVDTIDLRYSIDSLANTKANKYKAFFLSIENIGDQVMECFDYKKKEKTNIVNCLEIDCLLYNINNNITIIDENKNIITTDAKYYSSGSSYPILAFGNCGFITWDDNTYHGNKKLYAIISRDNSFNKNPILTKATPYLPLKQTSSSTINNGFYNSYFCLVKKPSFELSSSCYVSGNDVYKVERNITLSLSDFTGYIQLQNSTTYFIRSNFNLNYLSLTEDINDQIFSIGSSSSGIKQVAKVINSAVLSFIYELKSMYKDFRNKTFKSYNNDVTKVNFDNTIRVSNVLSDETFNNSVFKFNAVDYYNVPTDRGIIVKLFSIGNNIFVHTKGSLYKFNANQTIVANESDISLAESEPFEHGITQICDSQYGYAGIDNKHSGCITFDSYVFYDKQNNHIFAYSGSSQLSIIDFSIYKILDFYKMLDCRMIHDEKNNRILINFIVETDKEITFSFNYKQKAFISLHDITLYKAFNSKNICYSYRNGFNSIFRSYTMSSSNIYGNATLDSYLTDAPDEGTYKDCKFSISVILFPSDDNQRSCVDSVQYVADIVKQNINKNTAKTKHVLNIARNTKTNPVKEFFITTDECQSTSVITNTNDNARPNSLLDYKGFKYNLGFWTSNYFRNKLDNNNVYKYPNQPGIEYNSDGSISKQRIPNTDNYSLVYGKYFILTFGFINDKPIKFENVLINNSIY